MLAAKRATSTTPIVFFSGRDPVATGLVCQPRPGGNLTGFSILAAELMPKRFALLSELVPQVKVIALLVNPNDPNAERLERLRGDLRGFYLIRINDQWLVIFRWRDGEPDDVRIADYH